MSPDPEPSQHEMTAFGRGITRMREAALTEPDAEAMAAVDELFPTGQERVAFTMRFSALIVLSSSIAAFGLLADSAAVVIGAMLVAPLMTPILATAAATVRALNRELLIALATIAWGTLLAIAVGFLVSFVASETIVGPVDLPGEVRARTFPGLLDLGIAVTAGAAAGYILPRRATTSALPGVGIAVALVPPLAVVGITLEANADTESANALLLFATNLAAIVFSAAFMLLLAGFRPHTTESRKRLAVRVFVTVGAVLAVAVPLTWHTQSTLEDARLRRIVAESVSEWDPTTRISSLSAEVRGDTAHVEVLVEGSNQPDEVWALAQETQRRFGGPVVFELRYAQDLRFEVTVR
ncbi:MAG: DUF389 domain-containing protein [Acidimicrobiales bacterium]